MLRVLSSLAVLLFLFTLPAGAGERGAGLRIVSLEDRRTFYRTGGKEQVGERVHLQV
jgi:hypothetical protein